MKLLWLVLSLVPVSFFFHFYEYGQHIKKEEAPYLFLGLILYIVTIGSLSVTVKFRHVILINILAAGLSVLLAMYFIPNDTSWFKPFRRDFAVMFVAAVQLMGQLLIRGILRIAIMAFQAILKAKKPTMGRGRYKTYLPRGRERMG